MIILIIYMQIRKINLGGVCFLGNSTLNNLLKDYDKKRYMADLAFEKRKKDFFNEHPELEKVTNELEKLALDISKAILNNDIKLADKLKSDFSKLKKKKEDILNSLDIPERYIISFIRV